MYASMSWNSLLALFFFTTLAIAQNASDPSRKIDGNSLNSPQQQEQAEMNPAHTHRFRAERQSSKTAYWTFPELPATVRQSRPKSQSGMPL